jgi:hypothetical protein
VLAFGMARGGSTLLFNLLQVLAPTAGLTWFSLSDILFEQGFREDEIPAGAPDHFVPRGYCFGGFREFPRHPLPLLDTARAVLLVRDPRDMLVSQYYATVSSHGIPDAPPGEHEHWLAVERRRAQAQGVGAYCIAKAGGHRHMFNGYLHRGRALERPNLRVYRYEDVVFHKRDWVDDVCGWFGWRIPAATRHAAADRYDAPPPERPDPSAHIRQVTPGSHHRELTPEEIAALDATLAEPLRRFGYLPPAE